DPVPLQRAGAPGREPADGGDPRDPRAGCAGRGDHRRGELLALASAHASNRRVLDGGGRIGTVPSMLRPRPLLVGLSLGGVAFTAIQLVVGTPAGLFPIPCGV